MNGQCFHQPSNKLTQHTENLTNRNFILFRVSHGGTIRRTRRVILINIYYVSLLLNWQPISFSFFFLFRPAVESSGDGRNSGRSCVGGIHGNVVFMFLIARACFHRIYIMTTKTRHVSAIHMPSSFSRKLCDDDGGFGE